MADYLTDIKPLEDAGNTDAEILVIKQELGVTHKPINRAALMDILNKRGMLQKVIHNNSGEKWSGTVLNMQAEIISVGSPEQVSGIRLWLSHVTNPTNVIWDTTDPEYAATFWDLYQAFKDVPTMPTAEDFQALADLGGGWKFADLTVEQIAALRSEHTANQNSSLRIEAIQSLRAEIENTYINPFENDGTTTADEIRAAIKGGL
jgi:hypothetical protein